MVLSTHGWTDCEMGEDLEFRSFVRKGATPIGKFARTTLENARKRGLRYGGYYWDATLTEEPPIVFSNDDRSSWPTDFARALEQSEIQGWGKVGFEFDLQSRESWGLDITIRPRSDSPEWFQVDVFLKLSGVGTKEEMIAFLDSILVPLLRDFQPTITVGDVLEYNQYAPSVSELERGTPSDLCWFNFYSPAVTKMISHERLSRLVGLPDMRLVQDSGGETLLVLRPIPQADPRELARLILGLSK